MIVIKRVILQNKVLIVTLHINVKLVCFSVRKLDTNSSIDVIVMIDYDSSVLKVPNIMTTQNKKILQMGARPKYYENVNRLIA
jgi:hypothetical protein